MASVRYVMAGLRDSRVQYRKYCWRSNVKELTELCEKCPFEGEARTGAVQYHLSVSSITETLCFCKNF